MACLPTCQSSRCDIHRRHAGAVLTHAALIANSAGCSRIVDFSPSDVHISYLPLAHIYERVNTISCTHAGAAIGFYSGDVARLLEDIGALRPTIFASVPRLWNRIYDKVGITGSSCGCRPLCHCVVLCSVAQHQQNSTRITRAPYVHGSTCRMPLQPAGTSSRQPAA